MYKVAEGITHDELLIAPKTFDKNYCMLCKGLVSRQLLKTGEGYMDIFKWESKADVEYVQSTFMEDPDALAFAKYLDPGTLTMHNYGVLDSFSTAVL